MSWFRQLLGQDRDREKEPHCPVRFDLAGWRRERPPDATSTSWQWKDNDGDTLRVSLVREPAFANGETAPLRELRTACRDQASQANASIVQVDRIEIASVPGLLVITKSRDGLRALYSGRVVVSMAAPHYEVQIDAAEHGTTGQRDAVVTGVMAQCGELRIEPPAAPGRPGRIKGWFQDPYDAAFDQGALHCVADDERLDALLPRHPLAKVRATLRLVVDTATLDPAIALESVPKRPPASVDPLEPRRGRMSSGALGMLYFQARLFPESEQAFRDAAAESEASGRAPDADMAKQLLLLGLACDCQGKHRDAVPIFQRSEQVAAATLGANHALVGQAINNQARALVAVEDHAAAEPLFNRALAIFESKEGQDTNAAIALNGLGMVRNSQERYHEAIPLLDRALQIFEKKHGPQFEDCGTVWGHLAIAYARLGDQRRAHHALSRAQAIREGQR